VSDLQYQSSPFVTGLMIAWIIVRSGHNRVSRYSFQYKRVIIASFKEFLLSSGSASTLIDFPGRYQECRQIGVFFTGNENFDPFKGLETDHFYINTGN
jgi:hypothetical protein